MRSPPFIMATVGALLVGSAPLLAQSATTTDSSQTPRGSSVVIRQSGTGNSATITQTSTDGKTTVVTSTNGGNTTVVRHDGHSSVLIEQSGRTGTPAVPPAPVAPGKRRPD